MYLSTKIIAAITIGLAALVCFSPLAQGDRSPGYEPLFGRVKVDQAPLRTCASVHCRPRTYLSVGTHVKTYCWSRSTLDGTRWEATRLQDHEVFGWVLADMVDHRYLLVPRCDDSLRSMPRSLS
jgi:hypothetical protein